MVNPKVIAFYLPQFHAIPENDEWWGKGFTEWSNTKKAEPLYPGHYQPREPLNHNYYNLLDVSTLKNQAKLAREYGIYGFCIYQYWFGGKKLLEKPAELILENKDIDINFCISWANEPWTRAWDGKDKQVLMEQKYGNSDDWTAHFNYLLPFFKDERYIKIDGKPVFVIYRSNNIENVDDMVSHCNKLAIKYGFKGIYLLETLNSFQNKPVMNQSDGVIEFEPMFTMRHGLPYITQFKRLLRKKLGLLDTMDYDYLWSRITRRHRSYTGKDRYLGAFVDWDNTARKGKNGLVVTGATPEKFGAYLKQQVSSSNQEFIFINAWNEWAEGAYLEPDEKYKFQYLEQIKELLHND